MTTIPNTTRAFAKLWAFKFIITNPKWRDGDTFIDEWRAVGDYDINLYCEDGYLSVCAYSMTIGDDGFMERDNSQFIYIVRKGQQ